jgi:colanic acid/amylovoran biosynthesis glycosyltransferase
MTVLFWVHKFPVYSQTFVRDQIIGLLNLDVDVYIYSGKTRQLDEIGAINGFESYNLINKLVDSDILYPKSKLKRIAHAIRILFLNIFTHNLIFYFRTLNFKKYGIDSKNLHLFFFVNFLLQNKVDIIHAHFGTNGNSASVMKEIGLPLKLVTTFHGYDIRDGIKNKALYSPLISAADSVVSISNYNYKNLLSFGFKEEQIFSLNNGINIDFFKRQEVLKQNDSIKIITVARLSYEKGVDIGIEAFSNLLSKTKGKLEYHIVGTGKELERIKEQIKTLNIEKVVFLHGKANTYEVRDLMHKSDILLLTSRAEASPTVLLEAQASELLVVATDVGDVKAMVKSGIVVNPENISEIVNGLKKLIDHRADWSVLTSSGSKFVEQNFNITKQTQKLLSHYKQLGLDKNVNRA